MNTNSYQHYKEQSINTMTQGELLLLLYDELIKRLVRGDLALKKKDYPTFEAAIDRCMDILRYLDDTLNWEYALSGDLHRLYDYFLYELNRVKIGRNQTELDKIRPMLEDLRDTFRTAEKNCSSERK